MSTYATLAQARGELKAASDDAAHNAWLMQCLVDITGRIDEMFPRWRFEPVYETRLQDMSAVDRYSGQLTLDSLLLEATEILDGSGASLTLWDGVAANRAAANLAAIPLNATPIRALTRINGGVWQDATGDGGIGAIQITGFWGFRRNYSGAWKRSLDALTQNSASGAVLLHVSDPDGADITGRTPRFSPGQLIRVNDEYMNVTSTDGTGNTIGVEPDVNGTTEAAHLSGAEIWTWYPEPVVVRATLRWAGLIFDKRGNFEQFRLDGLGGSTQMPEDMPAEVENILMGLPMYPVIGAV